MRLAGALVFLIGCPNQVDPPEDAGDAGLADAGRDAGSDANVDGGVDAGVDGGVDAGLASGSLDPSFGAGGVIDNPAGLSGKMRFDSAGRLVIGSLGTIGTSTVTVAILSRFLPDGALDPAFAASGVSSHRVGDSAWFRDVAVVAGDDILAVGNTKLEGQDDDVLVARIQSDGTLDPAFGSGGILVIDDPEARCGGGTDDLANAAAIDSAGGLVIAGRTASADCAARGVLLFRLDAATGALDPSFGENGFARTSTLGDEGAADVALDTNGRIIVGGTSADPSGVTAAVFYRFDGAGQSDLAFGTNGASVVGIDITSETIAVDDRGRIYSSGFVRGSQDAPDAVFLRLAPDGTPDVTFGQSGRVTYSTRGFDNMNDSTLDRFQRYYAAGAGLYDFSELAVLRFDESGLDSTFAGSGLLRVGTASVAYFGLGVAIDAMDRPWVSAAAFPPNDARSILIRLIP